MSKDKQAERRRIEKTVSKWRILTQAQLAIDLLVQVRDELENVDYPDTDTEEAELDERAADHIGGAVQEIDEALGIMRDNGW